MLRPGSAPPRPSSSAASGPTWSGSTWPTAHSTCGSPPPSTPRSPPSRARRSGRWSTARGCRRRRAGAIVLTVNFLGTRYLTEALLPQIVEGGAVASVASLAGQGWPEHVDLLGELLATQTFEDGLAWVDTHVDGMDDPYFFSKEAVILWTRRRARTLRRDHGVRMSTVSPGPVDSPMMPSFREAMDEAVLEWTAREAIGRMARPDEMALPLVFLCAPGASYVSGIDLVADAGFKTDLDEGLVDFEGLGG